MNTSNNTILITGGSAGIGYEMAKLLSRENEVIITGRDENRLQKALETLKNTTGIVSDVSNDKDVERLTQTITREYPGLNIVINNAGVIAWAALPDIAETEFAHHLAVHLGGSFLLARAAWPHLAAQGYGRIVNTTSSGVFGLPNNTSYAAAKGGVIGLTRSLATAGASNNIKVNAIAPAAMTRMAGKVPEQVASQMDPDLVAPMAAYLAHEDCPVTGEIYTAGAGRFSRLFIASTPGYVHRGATTIEDVATHWDAINDETGYVVPADLMAWSASFMTHLSEG